MEVKRMENKNTVEMIKGFLTKYKIWVISVAVVFALVYTFLSLKPDGYQKLYENLTDQDKQEILAELSQRGVEYKLDETGQVISVKKENASWVRRELTEIGLPSTTTGVEGYDIFMQNSLGSTKKQLELQELKARKGQLELELVRSFPFIESATVNLNLPKDSNVFEPEEKKGSASVTIKQKRGSEISKQQVLGIQHMVSSALPGVPADSVKIIDGEKGIISDELLSEKNSTSSSYEKQMAIESQAERNIHDDIKNSLSSLFGYDNIKINVKVSINFDEIVQNIEKYGDKGITRSKNDKKEDTVKVDGVEKPEAGIDANGEVVGYDVNAKDGNVVYQQKKEDIIENFEIDKTVETVKKNPQLTNKNVVVWIDQRKLDEKNIDINQFRQAVGIAAGLTYNQQEDTFQNGQVSIMSTNFEEIPEPAAEKKVVEPKKGFLSKYGIYLIIGLVLLLVGAGIIIFVLSKKKKKLTEEAAIEAANEAIARQESSLKMVVGDEDEEEDEEDSEQKLEEMKKNKRHKELNEQVIMFSDEHPKETSEYIKRLLKERK